MANMELRILTNCLFRLLVIAYCVSILSVGASDTLQQRRQSSQQQQRIRLPRRLSSRHNELSPTEATRKTLTSSHRLVAGHLRADADEAITSTFASTRLSSTPNSIKLPTSEDTLLLSSAGAGKDKKSTTNSDDDEKKTLSQQVKEGKYGLIQDELFAKKSKRPGILSYSPNPEVPGDTIKNLGGLDEDEIWLAENHVLVLRGGSFHETVSSGIDQASEVNWPPIDNYKAPRRQVKIPPRPKVPPPFPVQLIENGPIELIGTNGSISAENGTIDFEALPGGFRGFLPGEGPYFTLPTLNNTASSRVTSNFPEKRNKADGATGPFYPALPPGAVIVPPPSNQTDYDDEDQSIYYPPPYSFVYPQDNSTEIPPGPLVPGIILPPPPDFFSSLDEKKPSTKDTIAYGKTSSSTPSPLPVKPIYVPPRKLSTKIYKTPSVTALPIGSKTASYNPKPFSRTKAKNSTYHQLYHTEKTTSVPTYSSVPFVEVTTPVLIKTTTLESQEKLRIKPLLGNQVIETSTEKTPLWKPAVISNKAVPLITFFASTTPTSVDQPVETTPSTIRNILMTTETPTRVPSQASYYFYEESSNEDSSPSSTPAPILVFSTTPQSSPYYKLEVPTQQLQEDGKKDYYDVEMIPSQQEQQTSSKTTDYNVKLIDSFVKDPQIFRYLDSGATNNQEKFEMSPLRSQSPRMLHPKPLYYQSIPIRASPPRLSYFATPKPKNYYHEPKIGDGLSEFNSGQSSGKSKPIYQYSFEATNYPKHNRQAFQQKSEPTQIQLPRRQKELSLFNEYQGIQEVSDQYDFQGTDHQVLTTEQPTFLAPKKSKTEHPYYAQSTTAAPLRDTTLAGHQQYFTKQDEQLLDDVTKEYFTMFGKKLPSTTPIYGKSSVTERPTTPSNYLNEFQANSFRAPHIKVRYGDHTPGPYSLKDDVLINYRQPLPPINQDAGFMPVTPATPVSPPKFRIQRPVLQVSSQVRDYAVPSRQRFSSYDVGQRLEQQQLPQRDVFADSRAGFAGRAPVLSLASDVAVNYKNPQPPINPDAEFIGPSRVDVDKPNSYFAYRLPGDGGHFYFLTPQAVNRNDPGYLYSRPVRGSRSVRSRRSRGAD